MSTLTVHEGGGNAFLAVFDLVEESRAGSVPAGGVPESTLTLDGLDEPVVRRGSSPATEDGLAGLQLSYRVGPDVLAQVS